MAGDWLAVVLYQWYVRMKMLEEVAIRGALFIFDTIEYELD